MVKPLVLPSLADAWRDDPPAHEADAASTKRDSTCQSRQNSRSTIATDKPARKRRARRKSSTSNREPLVATSQNLVGTRQKSSEPDLVGKEIQFRRKSSSSLAAPDTGTTSTVTTDPKTKHSSATARENDNNHEPLSLLDIFGGTSAPPLPTPRAEAEELAEIAEEEETSTPASLGGLLSWKNTSPLETFHHRRPKRTDSTTLLLPIPSLREELNTPSEHSPSSEDKETAATKPIHKYTETDSRSKTNLSTLLEGSMNAENMIELQEENQILKAELEALRNNYAENIVPLQDLMDEKNNLDAKNTMLKRDNEELCLVIERLEQEKTEVNGWFSDLESQMVRNFHSVFVEATKETTQKNLQLRERITILEIELDKATGSHSRQEAEPVVEKTTRQSQNQFRFPPLLDSRSSTTVKDTETPKDGEDLVGPECATFSPSGQSEKELCWRDDAVGDFALKSSRRRRRSSFLGCRPTKENENEVASDSERATPKSTDDAQDFPSWDDDDDDKSPPVSTRRKRTDSGTLLLPIPSLREEQSSPTEMASPLEDEAPCNSSPMEYAPPVKMSEKTILHTLKEDSPDNGNKLAELRERVESLLLDNKKLTDQLVCFRNGYEDRVTPFRDLFEEKRELLKKIGILGKETRTLRLQNARLSQENEGFNTSITELQSQMAMAVQKLVEKVKTLTAENANLKQQIAGLESEFSDNNEL